MLCASDWNALYFRFANAGLHFSECTSAGGLEQQTSAARHGLESWITNQPIHFLWRVSSMAGTGLHHQTLSMMTAHIHASVLFLLLQKFVYSILYMNRNNEVPVHSIHLFILWNLSSFAPSCIRNQYTALYNICLTTIAVGWLARSSLQNNPVEAQA